MSRPVAIPHGFETLDGIDASEIMSSSRLSADLLRSGQQTGQQRLSLGSSADKAKSFGSSPSSPTHRSVWGSVFHPGRNANMPRGRDRFDHVEPGSPTTWDQIVRAEQQNARVSAGGSGASTPTRTSMDAPAPKVVDLGKLDALMQARFKEANGKLSYHDYAEVMRGLSS